MKLRSLLIMLTFFILVLTGCQEKSSSKKSSNQNPYYCYQYPNDPVCSGNNTTGGTTGNYNYCQMYPYAPGCYGGNTTGSSTGGTSGTTNCSQNPFSFACYCQTYPRATGCPSTGVGNVYPYWGVRYPPVVNGVSQGIPPENCSAPQLPSGMTQAHETRKGTVTIAGHKDYNLIEPEPYLNTSSNLMTKSEAKQFFITDSYLKIRFKPNIQPELSMGDSICYGRASGQSTTPGYTKLTFYVNVYSANGALLRTINVPATTINSCSQAYDLSNQIAASPAGIFITVRDVKANQDCWWSDGPTGTGFTNCNKFKDVRAADCWSMDIEVAADGTKTF